MRKKKMKKVIREQLEEIATKFIREKYGCDCNVCSVDDMRTYAYVECPLHNKLFKPGFSERVIVMIDLKSMKILRFARFTPVEEESYDD